MDDKKIKDILTYISGMKYAEQIRMMFLCSLNGMRSINFAYLQVKDVLPTISNQRCDLPGLRQEQRQKQMFLLYEQPDEEGILRIFEVFATKVERQTDTGDLFVYEPKAQ